MRGGSGGRADVFGLCARATTLPARRPETAKPLRGKRLDFGGNKRAGEGTHQATGVGARRATFLRMNLSCREVRVPWVRPADARLIASILVNDTPTQLSEDALDSQVSHCFLPLGCGRESFRATRRRRVRLDLDEFAKKPAIHRRTPCARTNRSRGHEARTSFGTARVGYRRLMLIWHFVRKMTGGQRPTERSHKKKADEIRKGGNCGLPVHTHLGLPSAPRRRCRFCTRVGFSLDYPFRADLLDAAHAPPRSERARPSRWRTYRVSPDVSSRPSVQSSARSRAHESRSGDAFDPTLEIALGCGDAREIRDDVGRGAIPPPSRDPPVVWESAGDRRRARFFASWRHATRRPPPTRAQRDRGFRVRAFGDERALALALPSPSLTPAVVLPSLHSPRTRRSTSSRPVRCRC